MCLPNLSDTAPNAPITTGTTVTFFSFHNFLIFSMGSCYLSIFSSYLCLTRASPGMATSMIMAFFACLLTKTMSGPRASTILSHCTLKSHRNLKSSFSTTCSGELSVLSISAFPQSYQCTYFATLIFTLCQLHALTY